MEPEITFREKQKTLFARVKKLRDNATKEELFVKSKLEKLGIRYMFQKGFIQGDNYCIADFYLPKPNKTVIEIDGGYHLQSKQLIRDNFKDAYYKERNLKVLRIKNEDVYTFDFSIFI